LPGWDTAHNWISYLFKDSGGNIWATSNGNDKTYVLTRGAREFGRIDYSGSVYKELLVPGCICEDRQGNIWMSCHGICRINSASGQPDFYMDSFPYLRIPRRDVTAMTIDKSNILWAGINNNGLAGYDISKGTFRHYTTNEGLPDNFIKSVYPLRNTVWVATASGMASLNTVTGKIARFGKYDGFPVLPVTTSDLFYDTAAHYLYCGFTDRIVRFNPDSLSYTEQPPSFFIESVHFFNDTTYYHPQGTITIPYYKNDITVTLGTINYNDESNQRIAYRLAGSKDSTWIPLSGDIINFNNLSPGTYRLQVQLSAANNRWHTQRQEIEIVITVPFWKTSWFIVLVIGVVLALIYIIYRHNINIVRRTERANEQLAEAQLTALQAQMNPHFIFNALNSIKRMVLDNETRNASRYLSRFAQMIRLTLNHSKETFVTLQETIEYLHAYLEMEQLRFGSSFSYIIQATGIADEEEITIPTLMIQPLVENAIWHGLMPKNGDKKITIRFEQTMDMVTCTISDNGIGIGESEKRKRANKQPSVGLENLRYRIKIMNEKYNMNCTLAITDLCQGNGNETGTRVVLQFKIL
jgi:histidine kinase/YXYXY domain-containing protein/histidine kinase/DNA gyrase B/HSP90-like ATPase/two component regulator with propeller domain